MAFSCGARAAFRLMEKGYLRSMLSRRQLQGFVGLPSERMIELKIFGFEPRVLGHSSQHLRPNLISIMKRENHIGPTRSGKDLVRTGFALDIPADTEKRGENTLRFGL
jgi:hypothetical protein